MTSKTILNNQQHKIVIKKSKFIALTFKVKTLKHVQDQLKQIKKQYHDASHICYAYIIEAKSSYDDDKEPKNTSGSVIFRLLNNLKLRDLLVIVVRYYGGVKLGASNLMHAYKNSAYDVILKSEIINYVKQYFYIIKFNYSNLKQVNRFLLTNNCKIISKTFQEKAIYFEISCNNEINSSHIFEIYKTMN